MTAPEPKTDPLIFVGTTSWVMLSMGGLFVWGPGGLLFGCGLWLAFAMVCTTIERSTTKKEN